jgi:hypothetical protein
LEKINHFNEVYLLLILGTICPRLGTQIGAPRRRPGLKKLTSPPQVDENFKKKCPARAPRQTKDF